MLRSFRADAAIMPPFTATAVAAAIAFMLLSAML